MFSARPIKLNLLNGITSRCFKNKKLTQEVRLLQSVWTFPYSTYNFNPLNLQFLLSSRVFKTKIYFITNDLESSHMQNNNNPCKTIVLKIPKLLILCQECFQSTYFKLCIADPKNAIERLIFEVLQTAY